MSTLDDKILGEKTHYYCSSDDEDPRADDDDGDGKNSEKESASVSYDSEKYQDLKPPPLRSQTSDKYKWDGVSCNTGPKGVIQDFRRYKQFESEARENRAKDKKDLIKKLSMTCRSFLDEKSSNNKDQQQQLDELDDENDPFINEYIAKRMKEMLDRYQQQRCQLTNRFGELKILENGEDFLTVIDDPQLKSTLIVTHIFNRKIPECHTMNQCLGKLAKKYPNVMFATLEASSVGMSREFTKYGVPALLIYKNGELIGNFVSLGDEFGQDFDENDVEEFLVENNILVSSQLISSISVNSNLSKIQKQQQQQRKN